MFTGCGTALVTPFRQDLSLDEDALRRLVRRQVDAGINFLVPCGTTGESPTLSREEQLRLVEITIEEARRSKTPVVAGAGGANTAHVIEMAREFQALGASGILSVTPYYNKPTQEGLYQHYKAIADAISLPIILYNIPGRTGVNIEPATLVRLAEIENIVAVKEASGNISQMAAILDKVPPIFWCSRRRCDHAAADGAGRPRRDFGFVQRDSGGMARLVQLALANDFAAAREIHRRYARLMEANSRNESRSRESGDGADGLAGTGVAAADGGAEAGKSGENSRRARIGWAGPQVYAAR